MLLALFAFAAPSFAQGDGEPSLRGALGALAARHDFTVHGLETVDDAPAPAASGTPLRRIEVLLGDYNYMLVRDPAAESNRS